MAESLEEMDLGDLSLKAHLGSKLYPSFLVWVLRKRLDSEDLIKSICEFAFDLRRLQTLKSPTAQLMTNLTRRDLIDYYRTGDVRVMTIWHVLGTNLIFIYSEMLLDFETPEHLMDQQRDRGLSSQHELSIDTDAFTRLTSTYALLMLDFRH